MHTYTQHWIKVDNKLNLKA